MLFGFDDNARYQVLLQRRKEVKPGNSKLQVGDLFTISFNLATGDRGYMDCIWRVHHASDQKVYAESVINADRVEEPGIFLSSVGRRHLFDVGEYQFYEAAELHDLIVAEREKNVVLKLHEGDSSLQEPREAV